MVGGRRLIVIITLAAAVLLGPLGASATFGAHAGTGDWIEDGFDAANTGFNPSEHVLTTANVGQLEAGWNIADATSSDPAVVDGHVYVESPTAITRYNLF